MKVFIVIHNNVIFGVYNDKELANLQRPLNSRLETAVVNFGNPFTAPYEPTATNLVHATRVGHS
jgi:hypothetical protein